MDDTTEPEPEFVPPPRPVMSPATARRWRYALSALGLAIGGCALTAIWLESAKLWQTTGVLFLAAIVVGTIHDARLGKHQ